MPLHVTRIRPARQPSIGTDPLEVRWFPVGSVGPVYYMLYADHGGLLEVQVEPLTGELVAVILVLGPPLAAPPLVVPDADDVTVVEGTSSSTWPRGRPIRTGRRRGPWSRSTAS